MDNQPTREDQLNNQESTLTDLSKLIDTIIASMMPEIPLSKRFRSRHRLIIELYIKELFTLKRAQHVIFIGKEVFDELDLYAIYCALDRGLEEIDELYERVNDPEYFPKEITASLLTFLKEYGYEKFYLSEEALATIS
jgi:hypothetical protein